MTVRRHGVKPFPPDWWRNVDFIAPLSLQKYLAPDKEMVFLQAHGSSSRGRSRVARTPKRVGGLQVVETSRTSTGARLIIGNPDPGPVVANERRTTTKEMLEALPAFGIEDAVIEKRIVIHELPDILEKNDVLCQFNDLYELQNASPRRTSLLRRTTNLPIWDVYRNLLKPELVRAGIKFNSRRLQSALVTNWVIPCIKEKGYYDFVPYQQELMLGLSADTDRKLWWLDTAAPHTREFRVDGIRGSLRVFRLVKSQRLTALKLPEL